MEHLFSLGSMVQKGKFSAGAALFVRMLKNVDFPESKNSGLINIELMRCMVIVEHTDIGKSNNTNFQIGTNSANKRFGFWCCIFLGRHFFT